MQYQSAPEGKDSRLWYIAQKRVAFKSHLASYLIINMFFWVLWYFTGARIHRGDGVPWPVWPALGWGIGLAFHYIGAYVNTGMDSIEKEYDKLNNQNKN